MPDVWQNLRSGDGLRVSKEGKFDFFWAVLEQNTVAMILRLPEGVDCTLAVPKFKSLEVNFRQLDKMSLVLRLLDDTQRDLFHTLCKDVVLAAEQGQDLNDAVARAIRRTRRWSFLLRGGSQKGLSVEEQRGLVGELAFLGEIKTKLGAAAAIEAWKGPEGSPKDFEFPGVCVEVKARRGAAKPLVRISSEDQLADVEFVLQSSIDTEKLKRIKSVAVKSVLPLGLCFLPAFILLAVIPIVAGLIGGITQ